VLYTKRCLTVSRKRSASAIWSCMLAAIVQTVQCARMYEGGQ
jgi:hypothetical protein